MNLLRAAAVLVLLYACPAWADEGSDTQQGTQDAEDFVDTDGGPREARRILQDALDEHLPWWMPKERSDSEMRFAPDQRLNLQVEGGERLSLDQVVLQIRRSYDGRVVRATETGDGFVIRLLLEGGRLRTLHVSPEGEVVRAQLDE